MGQRLSTQAAQRQYDKFAARNPTMRLLEFGHRCCGQCLQCCFSQMGVRAGNVQCIIAAFDQLHPKRKAFLTNIIAA